MKRKLETNKIAGKFQTWRRILSFLCTLLIFIQAFPQGENWRVVTNMPIPRHDVSSCVVDGKIYVIGGMSHEYAVDKTFFKLVTRFDLETEIWDTCASLPESRLGAFASYINDKIYLFGGRKDFHSQNSVNVYIYDIEKDEWTSGTDMPWGTTYAGGCVYDNKIYLIGGIEEGTTTSNPTNTVLRYDPAENSWDTLANMNQARAILSVSVVDNKIYAIGGVHHVEGTFYDVLEEYDPVSNEWIIKNPVPSKISLHCSIIFNDRIWVLSGTTDFTNPINESVYIYEPATDNWSNSATEDVPCVDYWDPELVTYDKKVYLLCGSEGINFGDLPEVIAFDFPVARLQNDTVFTGESFEVLFYEDGDIYVTPSGTDAEKTAIEAASISQEPGTAGQKITLQMETPGTYWIYGIASDGRLDRGYSSVDIITSVSKEKIPDLRFYPNPAGDYITVELPAAGDISLFNLLGKEITGIYNVSGKTTISVSELPQGVYFLKVNCGKEFRIEKVIVE